MVGRQSAIYLSKKELELLGQNPGARVEVVLVGKEVLHHPDCSAQGDFPHHLSHAWGRGEAVRVSHGGPPALKQLFLMTL